MQNGRTLRWYGYLGLLLIMLAELNFRLVIQPFADWYIVVVWTGYILFVDSLVYLAKGKSLISSYTKEFVFVVLVSLPFWSIFEFYNLFSHSWHYVNYPWYVHPFDFLTILPAILETFTLLSALNVWSGLDSGKLKPRRVSLRGVNAIRLLAALGVVMMVLPAISGPSGFVLMWMGMCFLFDPLNYLTGRPSLISKASQGRKSIMAQLATAGVFVGFFWEFWNHQAYPMWFYTLPSFIINVKLFEMPLEGYIGYTGFGISAFLFYAFFRGFVFRKRNSLLSM